MANEADVWNIAEVDVSLTAVTASPNRSFEVRR